jgi:hypothetical protein
MKIQEYFYYFNYSLDYLLQEDQRKDFQEPMIDFHIRELDIEED